ncbi:hypothetical protein CAOG_04932 [Capsaspora owczarzaki ATCC 30864]|uniref:Uncharacterized protein n=1 Tax=Capsaspora owczarzaki (strain ATCC 30864) TaxID=595528 RepID=A0A0D2WS90_CAPO3|nr:hypothetical protein CAOG_04932 [Capsaspora owczarzaki ATCC 30864]KJE94263.1 hypothetical protein CAOG_004932 [Capsaspora owczarzaki ATCC 30864]|eukprot:XP_004347683.2 hypothetical protein CAOG_04932 [Capsaspora owczarzaki ATCC 30864]
MSAGRPQPHPGSRRPATTAAAAGGGSAAANPLGILADLLDLRPPHSKPSSSSLSTSSSLLSSPPLPLASRLPAVVAGGHDATGLPASAAAAALTTLFPAFFDPASTPLASNNGSAAGIPGAEQPPLLPGEQLVMTLRQVYCVVPIALALVAKGTLTLTDHRLIFHGRTVSSNPNRRFEYEYYSATSPFEEDSADDDLPSSSVGRMPKAINGGASVVSPGPVARQQSTSPVNQPPPGVTRSASPNAIRASPPAAAVVARPSPPPRPLRPAAPTSLPVVSTRAPGLQGVPPRVLPSTPPRSPNAAATVPPRLSPRPTPTASSSAAAFPAARTSIPMQQAEQPEEDSRSDNDADQQALLSRLKTLRGEPEPDATSRSSFAFDDGPDDIGVNDGLDSDVGSIDSSFSGLSISSSASNGSTSVANLSLEPFYIAMPVTSIGDVNRKPASHVKSHDLWVSEGVQIACRNFGVLRICVSATSTAVGDFTQLITNLVRVSRPVVPRKCFAYAYRAGLAQALMRALSQTESSPVTLSHAQQLVSVFFAPSGPNFVDIGTEIALSLHRSDNAWRIVHSPAFANCVSYPAFHGVPLACTDAQIGQVAAFHKEGRFPIVAWTHPTSGSTLLRAASPKHRRGTPSQRSEPDEKYLQAICLTSPCTGDAKLVVFSDLPTATVSATVQSSYSAAQGGMTAVQGELYYYPHCQFELSEAYLSDPKALRSSYIKLQAMLYSVVSEAKFQSLLEESRWLEFVSHSLSVASKIAQLQSEPMAPHVLVAYERGWDKTLVVCALVQLLQEPAFRTLHGFQKLIQKEFIVHGHRFPHRTLLMGLEPRTHEDSPVFLLFLDAVWQLLVQFPTAFEFNEALLIFLADAAYSSRFGSFLFAMERDRAKSSVEDETISVWAYLNVLVASGESRFFNGRFAKTVSATMFLEPDAGISALQLWTNLFVRWGTDLRHAQSACTVVGMLPHASAAVMTAVVAPTPQQGRKEMSSAEFAKLQAAMGFTNPTWSASVRRTYNSGAGPLACVGLSEAPTADKSFTPPGEPDSGPGMRAVSATVNLAASFVSANTNVPTGMTVTESMAKGFLFKVGGVRKNWKRRWFVLDTSRRCLSYFEDEKERIPKGLIALSEILRVYTNGSAAAVPAGGNANTALEFSIVTARRIYVMRAANEKVLRAWVLVVNASCLRS